MIITRTPLRIRLAGGGTDFPDYLLGNCGSVSTASHFACDLGKGTAPRTGRRFRVIALTDNIPLLTAWANDTEYANVFVEQLRNLVNPGDVVLALTGAQPWPGRADWGALVINNACAAGPHRV